MTKANMTSKIELGYRPFTELAANTFLIPNFKLKTATDP